MSFNQPPPNPYGQPPQPGPNPGYGYPPQGGAPQQPGQPGPYGYPQQQAANPYGQPGPYGQQANPYAAQPGWGGPPPPRKGNAGKVIAIVLAAVVVVGGGGIAIAMNAGGSGDGSGGSGPGQNTAQYKLTTPLTVATDYQRQGAGQTDADMSASDKSDLDDVPGMTDSHEVEADYQKTAEQDLTFIGAYGSVSDPNAAVDAAFASFKKEGQSDDSGKPVGQAQSFHPAGFDGTVLKCQEFQASESGSQLTFPLCVWGDSSTIGIVVVADGAAILTGRTTPLSQAAATTAEVRRDARVAIS